MENSYKNYSLFNDVQDPLLRSYNRVVAVMNIREDFGDGYATGYLHSLPEDEKDMQRMMAVAVAIKQRGLDSVKAEVNRTCQLNQN